MPQSVLGDKRSIQAVFADTASTIGQAEFSFDDIVVNSRAYRQAMAAAMSYAKRHASSPSSADIPEQSSVRSLAEGDDTPDAQADGLPTNTTPAPGPEAIFRPRESGLVRTMNTPTRPYWSRGVGLPSAGNTQPPTSQEAEDRAQLQQAGYPRQEQGSPRAEVGNTFNAEFARAMELPSSASVEWVKLLDYEGLDLVNMSEVPKPVIDFQTLWWEILTSEKTHICFLQAAKHVFLDQILTRWPKIVQAPQQFVAEVFDGIEDLEKIHTEHLYNPLVKHWMRHGVWAPFDPKLLADLLDHASHVMRRYCSDFIMARQRVAMECFFNPGFRDFLNSQRAHPAARGLEWQNIHKAPITRLHRYCLLLEGLRQANRKRPDWYRMSPRYPRVNVPEVETQVDEIVARFKQLTTECDDIIGKTSQQEEQLCIRACFKPREYITSKPTDLAWLPHTQTAGARDYLQAFCLFEIAGQDKEWAWCNFFFPDDGSLVIVDIWDWLDPTHRCRNPVQAPASGALSVKWVSLRPLSNLLQSMESCN